MNKNLILKMDDLGGYISCPYCKNTITDLEWYKNNLRLNEFSLKGKVFYLTNRYNAEIRYCSACGGKLNFKNLQKKLSKDNENTR